MSKKRIYELAKELGIENKVVQDLLKQHNIEAKSHMSGIDESAVEIVKRALQKKAGNSEQIDKQTPKAESKGGFRVVQINESSKDKKPQQKTGNSQHRPSSQDRPKPQQGRKEFADRVGNRDGQRNNGQKRVNADREGSQHRGTNSKVTGSPSNGVASNRSQNDARPRNNGPQQPRNNERPKNNGGRNNTFQKPNNNTRPENKNINSDTENRKERRNKKKDKRGNIIPKNRPQSLVSTAMAKKKNKVKQRNEQNIQQKEREIQRAEAAKVSKIELSGPLTVKELAEKMGRDVSEIIKKLMLLGVMATINQEVDLDTAMLVADDLEVTVVEVEPEEDPTEIVEIIDAPETLKTRPPVVTIMGHVDHGKTSLLDVIRKTNVTASEAGGITQHIGAYMVRYNNNKITFLDTPGHEAFTAMRLRGAQSTDIAVLVVAADDGVKPQTVEAINHAKSANIPIIVAINKIDKAGANPDHVKQQLSEYGLVPEEWGGDVIMVPVSAKAKLGIDDLLENILLVAEVMELKANPNRFAEGVVIEAQLDKGRGPVCTVLVQKGTLRVGDTIIAGTAFGKVRAMNNERGENVKAARPSTPVEVLGLSEVPLAGEIIDAVDDNTAREIADKRAVKQKESVMKSSSKVTLDDIFKQIQEGELKELNLIIKADVQGSAEALRQSLENIENQEVRIVIVHSAVGAINESDVMLASASNAIIIGFNVRPDATVRKAAEKENVDLRTYRVIYDAINDVESAMRGMLAPQFKEVILGRAEVRQVISTPKAIVAGCYVTDGKITNHAEIRLIRDGIVVHEGQVDSLRRFKDEAKEVQSGYECGVSIERYRDIKEGDVIEAFTMEEIAPVL